MDIALAYREIEEAEKLLAEIQEARQWGKEQNEMQLRVLSGNNGPRHFGVPWSLVRPIIEAHIASKRAVISALNEKALIELAVAS